MNMGMWIPWIFNNKAMRDYKKEMSMKTKMNSITIGNFVLRRERLVKGTKIINEKYYTEHMDVGETYEQMPGSVNEEMTKVLFDLTEGLHTLLDTSDEHEALQAWRELKLVRLITE